MDDSRLPQARTDPPGEEGTCEFPVDHFFQLVLMHTESLQAWTAWKGGLHDAGKETGQLKSIAAERTALLMERIKATNPSIDRHNEGDADR